MSPSSLLWLSRLIFYSALLVGTFMAFAPANESVHQHVNDKLMHGLGFFLFAMFSHFAHPRVSALYPMIGLSLFGLGIELVQAYLPYRSFSWMDWFADLAGIGAYYFVCARFYFSRLFEERRYGQC